MQTNQFARAVFSILGIVQRYMDQQMNEATCYAVATDLSEMELKKILIEKIEGNKSIHRSNEKRNLYKAIVDAYESDKIILDTYGETVTLKRRRDDDADKDEEPSAESDRGSKRRREGKEPEKGFINITEVLTRSSHSSRTSYAVVADLSEMELKKILIEKIEGNKSIQCSDEQRNLYKALVDAYESDKIILDTYGETVTLKRRRDDDEDKDEEPFAGPDQGSKRRREGKEPESASTPSETTTRSASRSTTGSRSRQASASESALVEEPVQTTF
nr:hypothetical protein [Tanacetum cinerariifolium]